MIKEAIILAGGLGARLRERVPDLPKCMAPVAGRPFIAYVIDYLRMQGIEHFVLSLGYRADVIEEYLKDAYATLSYKIVIEDEPLGTGGAIQLAIKQALGADVLVTNGDTLYKVDIAALDSLHRSSGSECTLGLKPMTTFDRYGVVQVNGDGKIESFLEKQFYPSGLINGGLYIIKKEIFLERRLPIKFSFEKDYLEKFYKQECFYGLPDDGYFIDIGIPEDFSKANEELQKPKLELENIDASWTLFLDRDGVINNELPGTYVMNKDAFVFSEGVLKAFPILAKKFGRIIVVSNQRGIGKGLMNEEDLADIHNYMKAQIESTGATIEKIYYCTEVESSCFNRKPNPGMALQASKDNVQINFSKSVMVGNKISDMQFGRAAGMHTVFIASTNPDQLYPHPFIDLKFTSLLAFAESL